MDENEPVDYGVVDDRKLRELQAFISTLQFVGWAKAELLALVQFRTESRENTF